MPSEADVISVVASPRRREILRLVWNGELTAGAIHQAMPDVTFGAVSLQLRTLLDAGLVEARAGAGSWGPLGEMRERMWDDALWRLKLQAELEETRRGPRPASKG